MVDQVIVVVIRDVWNQGGGGRKRAVKGGQIKLTKGKKNNKGAESKRHEG